jgi:hypothetical protein
MSCPNLTSKLRSKIESATAINAKEVRLEVRNEEGPGNYQSCRFFVQSALLSVDFSPAGDSDYDHGKDLVVNLV